VLRPAAGGMRFAEKTLREVEAEGLEIGSRVGDCPEEASRPAARLQ
jgi:hypothetical protein